MRRTAAGGDTNVNLSSMNDDNTHNTHTQREQHSEATHSAETTELVEMERTAFVRRTTQTYRALASRAGGLQDHPPRRCQSTHGIIHVSAQFYCAAIYILDNKPACICIPDLPQQSTKSRDYGFVDSFSLFFIKKIHNARLGAGLA